MAYVPDVNMSGMRCTVFRSVDLMATCGATRGRGLGTVEHHVPGDCFAIARDATPRALRLQRDRTGRLFVLPNTEIGRVGEELYLDSIVTLMAGPNAMAEVLVLSSTCSANRTAETYLLPLSPLLRATDYHLVSTNQQDTDERLLQAAFLPLMQGTLVTLEDGSVAKAETLKRGDRVLTRDHGAQPLLWSSVCTQRVAGGNAPIRIEAGALGNSNDLSVLPDQRLLVYQRRDDIGIGRPELLVKARSLVNGTTVTQDHIGFFDVVHLGFDVPAVIFAEGVATELVALTEPNAPANHSEAIVHEAVVFGAGSALDASEALATRKDALSVLQKASHG
ncbi:MAG: Hint domain-containing protein [Pseudomonadota bacterium]